MQEHESREREDSQCWADRSDSPPLLFLPEGRSPGRGVQIHQKLSSPLRKRAGEDFIRELEEKQAKAQELRDRLQEEKAQRSRTMFEKVAHWFGGKLHKKFTELTFMDSVSEANLCVTLKYCMYVCMSVSNVLRQQ